MPSILFWISLIGIDGSNTSTLGPKSGAAPLSGPPHDGVTVQLGGHGTFGAPVSPPPSPLPVAPPSATPLPPSPDAPPSSTEPPPASGGGDCCAPLSDDPEQARAVSASP